MRMFRFLEDAFAKRGGNLNFSVKILAVLIILLYLIPIWRFKYFPSGDGPSHLYNAQVLKEFNNPEFQFSRYYKLNIKPFPNWTGHLLLLAFLQFAPPLLAEKILLTVYVVAFGLSLFYLFGAFGHKSRILALLGFMFIYNITLLFGFYSFSLGIPLLLISLGYFWKQKDDWSWEKSLLLSFLLVLLYFSHPVPYLVALATMTILGLGHFKIRWKKWLLPFASFIPSFLLFVNYLVSFHILTGKRNPSGFWNLPRLLSDFVGLKTLVYFDTPFQSKVAWGLSALLGILLAVTLAKKVRLQGSQLIFQLHERDRFFPVFAAAMAIYLISPDAVYAHGSYISMRLNLIAALFLVPLLSEDVSRFFRRGVLVAMIGLLAANFFGVYRSFALSNKELAEFSAGARKIKGHAVVVPLVFDKRGESDFIQVLSQAVNYYCLDNGNINLGNYEASKGYFPVEFRDDFKRPSVEQILDSPAQLDFKELSGYVDYLVAFGNKPGIENRISPYYHLVGQYRRLRLYERKASPE